ncbi:NAD(P)/FAD-dependent oxidoreductase [Oribacterium sp. Sow4_G1_1]|uniref:NAD(P)/FAD-dependent oxidoreductase n=1 Tax=Oribacterium sp. Sow4_G1_1 TaxID=3438794 RepID=UPI003F985D57
MESKRNENRKTTVAVIGGGAAGMMAAIEAARAGAIVTLIEKNPQLGKKLAMTGNGRCNYTNLDMSDRIGGKFRGFHPEFAAPALDALPPEAVLDWFRAIGVEPRFRGSYVYPNSDQASAVVDALREELHRLSVKVHYNAEVKNIQRIEKDAGYFMIQCTDATVKADRVILAAGSKAAPKTGSNGDGYFIARKLGHTIVPYVPALCGIRCAGDAFRALAGIRTEAVLELVIDGHSVDREAGELQLVDYGISGIPVFQLSRYAAYALQEGKKAAVYINFLPGFTEAGAAVRNSKRASSASGISTIEVSAAKNAQNARAEVSCCAAKAEDPKDLAVQLYRQRQERLAGRKMESFFTGLLHQKLGQLLLRMASVRPELPVAELSEKQLRSLASLSVRFKAECVEMNGFLQAQVVAGGVDTTEVDPGTMASRLVPGLYFAGEVLDIDGICGGYNLQWAWASGFVAGRHAAV